MDFQIASTDMPATHSVESPAHAGADLLDGPLAVYLTRPLTYEFWEAEPIMAAKLGSVGDLLVARLHHPCAVAVIATPSTSRERLIRELRALADLLDLGPDPQGPMQVATAGGFLP
jgi:hypothetical protein